MLNKELDKNLGILDCYRSGQFTYIDLAPQKWIEKSDDELKSYLSIRDLRGNPVNFSIHRSVNFYVAIFLKIEKFLDDNLVINKKEVRVTDSVSASPKIQLGIVFRENPSDVIECINFYKKTHGINRFVVYNFSTEDTESYWKEIQDLSGVSYYEWLKSRVTFTTKKAFLKYDPKGLVRFDKNSAYSHCLKKYRDAEWTLFVDSDELLINPTSKIGWLERYLDRLPSSVNTIKVRGYLGGKEAFDLTDLPFVLKRTEKEVKKRLILRTKYHDFTNCIHDVEAKPSHQVWLPDAYFFHLDINAKKKRISSLNESIHDKSLVKFISKKEGPASKKGWWSQLKQMFFKKSFL